MNRPRVMSEEARERSESFIKLFETAVGDRASNKQFDTLLSAADVLSDGLAKKSFSDAIMFWKEVAFQFATHLRGGEEHYFTKCAIQRVKKYTEFETRDVLKSDVSYVRIETIEDEKKREKYQEILREYAGILESRLLFGERLQGGIKLRWMEAQDKLMESCGDGSRFMEHIVEDVCKKARKLQKPDVIDVCAAQLVKCADDAIHNSKYPDMSLTSSTCQLWDCAFNYCAPKSEGKKRLIDAWERTIIALAGRDLKAADREIEWVWWRSPLARNGVGDPEMTKMVMDTQAELEPDHPSSMGYKIIFAKRRTGLG